MTATEHLSPSSVCTIRKGLNEAKSQRSEFCRETLEACSNPPPPPVATDADPAPPVIAVAADGTVPSPPGVVVQHAARGKKKGGEGGNR